MRIIVLLLLFCFSTPVFAQVDVRPIPGVKDGIDPREHKKIKMIESMQKRKANRDDMVEHRREKLRRVRSPEAQAQTKEIYQKHYRNLARIVRLGEIAKKTGNKDLAKEARRLMGMENKRHEIALRRAKSPSKPAPKPDAQEDSGPDAEPSSAP